MSTSDDFDHLAELNRVLEVLYMAFDGNRRLQRDGKGEFHENAAPLAAQIRATLTEIAAVRKAQPTQRSGLDELQQRRASREPDPKRRATPTRQRR